MDIDPSTPPAGIPPLVWLLVWLLVGPLGIWALLSKGASRLPGAAGALARWWQRREPAARSYRVSQEEIKRLDDMYTELRRDFDELQQQVRELEGELTAEKKEKWSLLGYVRILIDSHVRHAPHVEVPAAPVDLQKYV